MLRSGFDRYKNVRKISTLESTELIRVDKTSLLTMEYFVNCQRCLIFYNLSLTKRHRYPQLLMFDKRRSTDAQTGYFTTLNKMIFRALKFKVN